MKEIVNKLNNIFYGGDIVIIGCSGGPDSMCLLHLINTAIPKVKVICAHLNHNIRKNSDTEQDFVNNYCISNNIIFESQKLAKLKNSSEAILRDKRYTFFKEIITKYNAKYLLTAHHGDDLIETILMRIVRGSNLKGYLGFQFLTKQDNYQVIKPLISITKEEIMEYLKINKIPYVVDDSNTNLYYTRNRFRHQIIPLLKKEEKNILQKFSQYAAELEQYYQYVDREVNSKIKIIKKNEQYDLSDFITYDRLIQRKIIEYIFAAIYQEKLEKVSRKHIALVLQMIQNQKVNNYIKLPGNIVIAKEHGFLKIKKDVQPKMHYDYLLKDSVILPNNCQANLVKESNKTNNNCTRLLSKEIALPLRIRTRKNGDKLVIKNMEGHKKINDIFIEKKLSKEERDNWPIVVDAKDNILWLPGLKKTNFDKAKTQKYDIIIEYIEKGEKNEEEKRP